MPNYTRGKIYKIVNSVNNTIYIGSTTLKLLSQRMSCHRDESKRVERRQSPIYKAMRQLGVGNFSIRLLHKFPCDSKDELEAEEYKIIDQLIAQGQPLYNDTIGGRPSKDKIARCAMNNSGEKNTNFNCGSLQVRKRDGQTSWVFQGIMNGHHFTKTFSCNKYGYLGAKKMGEAIRLQSYPM